MEQKGPGSLNLNPYGQKGSDELSRKLSEFDNRGNVVSSGIRNKGYNRLGDPIRYKSNNYDMSEKSASIHHKLSVDHVNSASNIDLRNNARYRVESGKNLINASDPGSGYGQQYPARLGNQIVAPNSNNLNGLSRVYGKNGPLRSIA